MDVVAQYFRQFCGKKKPEEPPVRQRQVHLSSPPMFQAGRSDNRRGRLNRSRHRHATA